MKEAIVLAGGLGTRMRPFTLDAPKPMLVIAGKPFLEYLLTHLKNGQVDRVILSIGYLGEQIQDYFGDEWLGMELAYVAEDEPLGTGGAIVKCLMVAQSEHVFVFNGDTLCTVSLDDMLSLHLSKKAEFTQALKLLYDFERYGSVVLDGFRIVDYREKMFMEKGLINTGVYLLDRRFMMGQVFPEKFSFEVDFLQKKLLSIRGVGYTSDAYFIDIGVMEDYEKAQAELPRVIGLS